MKLKPKSYYWKTDEKKEKRKHGFMAQDIESLCKEKKHCIGGFEKCCKETPEGEMLEVHDYGLNYAEFIAPIVKATQELSEKVINLEKENKLLLNILQYLSNQLAEIRAEVFPSNGP